jgi:hypothetical protein
MSESPRPHPVPGKCWILKTNILPMLKSRLRTKDFGVVPGLFGVNSGLFGDTIGFSGSKRL